MGLYINGVLSAVGPLWIQGVGQGGGGGETEFTPMQVPLPTPADLNSQGTTIHATIVLNASGDKGGWVFQAPKAGNIRYIHWRTGTVTTPQNVDVRLETVDTATGLPSGTLFGTNTNGAVASGSLAANTWHRVQLTADAVVTKGALMAIAIVPAGVPNFQLVAGIGANSVDTRGAFPYFVNGSTGTYSKTSDGAPLSFAVEYSDGTFAHIPLTNPISTITSASIQSGTTPDELGNIIAEMPFGARCVGLWFLIEIDNPADVVLYDSANTVLASVTLDADIRGSTLARPYMALFTSAVDLVKGDTYRFVIKPTSAANVGYTALGYERAGLLDQCVGIGQTMHQTQRTDAGAWTETPTSLIAGGLILSAVETPV